MSHLPQGQTVTAALAAGSGPLPAAAGAHSGLKLCGLSAAAPALSSVVQSADPPADRTSLPDPALSVQGGLSRGWRFFVAVLIEFYEVSVPAPAASALHTPPVAGVGVAE